jgi:CheY-like chemotaxis protein
MKFKPINQPIMKRILVVEDDARIASALGIRLEAAGYEVLTAVNGLEGLNLVLDQKPDLIIMDIWMPVGIGFSVAQRLRSLGLGAIPVIFITASKLRGLRKAAIMLGAVGFFEKPYDSEKLLHAIAEVLALKGPAGPLIPLSSATSTKELCHEKNTRSRG